MIWAKKTKRSRKMFLIDNFSRVDEGIYYIAIDTELNKYYIKGMELKSLSTIAKQTNISRITLWSWCKKLGYEMIESLYLLTPVQEKELLSHASNIRGAGALCRK